MAKSHIIWSSTFFGAFLLYFSTVATRKKLAKIFRKCFKNDKYLHNFVKRSNLICFNFLKTVRIKIDLTRFTFILHFIMCFKLLQIILIFKSSGLGLLQFYRLTVCIWFETTMVICLLWIASTEFDLLQLTI